MERIITPEILEQHGFILRPNLIQDSYEYIIKDIVYEADGILSKTDLHEYKAMSASWCNDKGKGEYYLFLREGSTNKRHEDEVVSLTRELLYEQDLIDFKRLIK